MKGKRKEPSPRRAWIIPAPAPARPPFQNSRSWGEPHVPYQGTGLYPRSLSELQTPEKPSPLQETEGSEIGASGKPISAPGEI